MGNETSVEEKQEKVILRSPKVGQASDLYWASRAGDVGAVKKILATTTFNDLNRLELNGSTALHAASSFGHADVVRVLLLERGAMRHRKNRHGLTAYEEAANDEIRQLFHRPNNSRFCSNSIDDGENIFTFPTDQPPEDDEDDEDDNFTSDEWVGGIKDGKEVLAMRIVFRLFKRKVTSRLVRFIGQKVLRDDDPERAVCDEKAASVFFKKFLDEHVTADHPEYDKACKLLSKFEQTNKIEYLFHLYSLETPFYRELDDEYLLTFFMQSLFRLNSVEDRAFQGRSYRGLSMTEPDLKPYRWALRNKGSVIVVQKFCSTSVDERVARGFMTPSSSDKLSVLMVFNFPQACDMAIQLYELSKDLPCVSEFENEREVLLLPYTMFNVVNITKEDSNGQYTIYLENPPPTMADWIALWKKFREEIFPTT